MIAEHISAPIPHWLHPSSTVTKWFVFLTLFIIVSVSNGLNDRRLMTSQLIPSYSSAFAAYNEYLTILEKATIVTSFPSLIIFAFPIGNTKSISITLSGTSNVSEYMISFSKNTTGLGFLTACLSNPLQSSAS